MSRILSTCTKNACKRKIIPCPPPGLPYKQSTSIGHIAQSSTWWCIFYFLFHGSSGVCLPWVHGSCGLLHSWKRSHDWLWRNATQGFIKVMWYSIWGQILRMRETSTDDWSWILSTRAYEHWNYGSFTMDDSFSIDFFHEKLPWLPPWMDAFSNRSKSMRDILKRKKWGNFRRVMLPWKPKQISCLPRCTCCHRHWVVQNRVPCSALLTLPKSSPYTRRADNNGERNVFLRETSGEQMRTADVGAQRTSINNNTVFHSYTLTLKSDRFSMLSHSSKSWSLFSLPY